MVRLIGLAGALLACSIAEASATAALSGRFDLVCAIKGTFVREAKPDFDGSWAMPVDDWQDTWHLAIDLDAKRHMDIDWCKEVGRCTVRPIDRVDQRLIIFKSDPDMFWTIRRSDGRFDRRYRIDPYRVEVSTGTCRVKPFSGFPKADSKP